MLPVHLCSVFFGKCFTCTSTHQTSSRPSVRDSYGHIVRTYCAEFCQSSPAWCVRRLACSTGLRSRLHGGSGTRLRHQAPLVALRSSARNAVSSPHHEPVQTLVFFPFCSPQNAPDKEIDCVADGCPPGYKCPQSVC